MKTEVSAVLAIPGTEPIPGYTLEERIGVGGYGEVWRANAPGDLKKAIKIVHGPMTDTRIERELRAMERIRSVHHPMLLSVERFEIVNDHLLVVMELAEGSLKDRFDETLEGSCGISRDELLGHIRDAADALDFLYEKHQLQHLDVKPENLLMVGGRVKVADFGLIKDLADRSMSLVGGLTPVYAPPEVFDGKPTRHSDQYALAIVYQEMLTGEPPFTGRTAAQLASQHLHCEPNLAGLPAHDRSVIARALSKDPQRRYASCKTFVQELSKASENFASERIQRSGSPAPKRKRAPVRGQRLSSTSIRKSPPAEENMNTVRLSQAGANVDGLPDSPEVHNLPPLEIPTEAKRRPTLLIGLGETGMRTLRHWKRRFANQWEMLEQSPAFRVLLLDVDKDTIRNASQGNGNSLLTPDECLMLQLREAAEYRQRSDLLLEWLNRRWLYNIPRSRKTEGIRPLGRLALVDHFEKVADRLRREVSELMTPQAIQSTSEAMGVAFEDDSPQIILVGSAAGGIGGGAIFDLGYAVRDVLGDLGLADDHVLGVLAHSTPRRTDGREIAIANTLSTLSELAYYSAEEYGYPGEPACNIQPRMERRPPFAHTLVMAMGDQLDDAGFDYGCQEIAEFLYQATAGEAASVLGVSQGKSYADFAFEQASVGSFGVTHQEGAEPEWIEQEAAEACRGVIDMWLGKTAEQADYGAEMKSAVETIFKQLAISPSDVAAAGEATVRESIGEDADDCFRRIITEHRTSEVGDLARTNDQIQSLAKTIDQFTIGDRHDALAMGISLRSLAEKKMRHAADEPSQRIDRWLIGLLDEPRFRIGAAALAVSAIRRSLRNVRDSLEMSQETHDRAAALLRRQLLDPESRNECENWDEDSIFLQYAKSRTLQASVSAALQFINSLTQLNESRSQSVAELRHGFENLRFGNAEGADAAEASPEAAGDNEQSPPDEESERSVANLQQIQELSHLAHLEFFSRHKPFSEFIDASPQDWAALQSTLWSFAERVAANGIAEHQAKDWLNEGNQIELNTQLGMARPNLLDLGGGQRLLVIAPQTDDNTASTWQARVKQATGATPAFVPAKDTTITVCGLSEQTSVRNIYAYLIGSRPEFVKLAERLHVRIDIDWASVLA